MKAIVAVLVLAAIGWFAYELSNQSGPAPVIVDTGDGPAVEVESTDPDSLQGRTTTSPPTASTDVGAGRTTVDTNSTGGRRYAQGISGRVVDEAGGAIVGVEVYLRTIVPGGIFGTAIRQQQGIGNAPIATAVTDATGNFDLGVARVEPGAHEVWMTSDRAVDKHIPQVVVTNGEWRDIGNITMKRGAVIFGNVTDEATGAAIVGATVLVKNPTLGGMSPAPGHEEGVPLVTDSNGRFQAENIEPGALLVSASAPGYAKLTNSDVRVTIDAPQEVNFALPIGRAIDGVVTDSEGNPIAGAQISAVCLSTKTPMKVDVRCDRDGLFLIDGLVDAPFQLNAMAPGFLRATVQPIQAGETQQQIVLEKQGSARVRVVASNGRALQGYTVSVLRHFPQNDQFGRAHDIMSQHVKSRDLDKDGAFTVSGMNPGPYTFEIEAGGFAKTRSEPFEVAAQVEPPLVTVQMRNGGKIEGLVLGPDGQPLAGVEVSTMPPNLIEVPFLRDLQHLMTTEISKQQTKTNAAGRYSLDKLSAGTYQLKFKHPDAFVTYVRDIVVADEQTTEVETAQLERGTLVYGVVSVDGVPGVGVKVSISTAPEPGQNVVQSIRFSDEAVTDEKGRFEFGSRVPPGEYVLRAGRQGGNPLLVMLDFKKTEQQVTFANQDSFEYSPNILSN